MNVLDSDGDEGHLGLQEAGDISEEEAAAAFASKQ